MELVAIRSAAGQQTLAVVVETVARSAIRQIRP